MRIDLVSEHASPLALVGAVDAGGQNVHVAALAFALARQGVDVVVHTRRDSPSLPSRVRMAPRVWVNHIDAGPSEAIPKDELLPHMSTFSTQLAHHWRLSPPDVAHSHFWMSGLATVGAAQPLGIPVAHTYHALGVVKRRNQGVADTSPAQRIDIEEWLACTVDQVIATTDEERLELIAMGADNRRIAVVPCGVDLDAFSVGGPRELRSARSRRAVVVSRLVERKGIGNVIEALAGVAGLELIIAGGPAAAALDHDLEARRFRSLAARVGVADRVELRGAVGRAHVPALLRSADVVVCCPWYEPFGLVAIEAMACGVPVVASAVGGLAESVLHERTGVLVPPRSPSFIAGALRRLLADDVHRAELGRAAARRARGYGWDHIAEQTLAVAIRLAAGAKQQRRTA